MSPAVEQLLFFALLGVAGWLLLVRPQKRRAQALRATRDSVRVGSKVLTTAGLHAMVVAVEEDTVLLEIAPGVTARFATQAVVRVLESTGPDTAVPQQGSAPHD